MNRVLARYGIGLGTALIPTMASYILLRPGAGLGYLIGYPILVLSLLLSREVFYLSGKLAAKTVRSLATLTAVSAILLQAAGAAVIVVSLNLTPASAYIAWFRLAQESTATGVLSYMFTVKICFFGTLFAGAMLRHGIIRSLLGFLAMASIIFYAIYQTEALGIITAALIVSAILAVSIQQFAGKRGRKAAAIIQLLIVAAGLTLLLSRIEAKNNSILLDPIDDQALHQVVVAVYPDFPFLYNIPGYGHQLGTKDITGQPSLTARPVFRIKGEPGETIYLRTAVYDYYTGKGWAFNETRLNEAWGGFDSDFLARGDAINNPLEIEVLIDFFSGIPHTIDTSGIFFDGGRLPDLQYGSYDTGFVFDIPVVKGTEFVLDRGAQEVLPPTHTESYMQLPTDIPADAVELARLLGDPAKPVETAAKIKEYLTANYYYTLEPDRQKSWDDPAWDFLLTKGEGYCVHFATSFVLLARMNNIPARYVSGFLVHIPYDDTSSDVTGYSSHAWAEIWVPEKGWVVQEATPPMSPDFFTDPSYYEFYNPFENRYTARQLELIMGDRIDAEALTAEEKTRNIDFRPFALIPVFGLLAFIGYIYLNRSLFAPGSPLRKIRVISRMMIRHGIKLGINDPDSAGWIRWITQLGDRRPGARRYLGRCASILLASYFGGHRITRRDLRFIRGTYRAIFR
ncbi:MAG: hypothetical protein CMN78_05705 [Spirochaetales bacterium]|nr:hypothetical protein [Spirochaetales bacterium]